MPTVSVAIDLDKPEEFQDLEVELDQIILDECEKRSLKLPHGCLAGSCGSCRIEVFEGKEFLRDASLIEQNTIDSLRKELSEKHGEEYLLNKEIRLSCRARISTEGKVKIRPLK